MRSDHWKNTRIFMLLLFTTIKLQKKWVFIDCTWVDNLIDYEKRIFKIRLVAKDFHTKKCVNCNKVFSLVAKYITIRLVCAFVAIFSLIIDEMNVVTVFFMNLKKNSTWDIKLTLRKKVKKEIDLRIFGIIIWIKKIKMQCNMMFDEFIK